MSQPLHLGHQAKRVLCHLKGTIDHGVVLYTWFFFYDHKSTTGYEVFLVLAWCCGVLRSNRLFPDPVQIRHNIVLLQWAQLNFTGFKWLLKIYASAYLFLLIFIVMILELHIFLASNSLFHARIKHVKVDVHFIHEKVQNRRCKGPSSSQFYHLRDKLMVSEPPIRLRGMLT